MNTIYDKAKDYALKMHKDVNQMYHDKPYSHHLNMVFDIACQYASLIPKEDLYEVLAGCWVHDIIEDARQTYNDVKKNTNEAVAEYAYALTNEKGRTRKERANYKYYAGIREYKHAVFIKLCDRFANAQYSKEHGSSMFKQYQSEHDEFKACLYDGRYQRLWDDLEKYLK